MNRVKKFSLIYVLLLLIFACQKNNKRDLVLRLVKWEVEYSTHIVDVENYVKVRIWAINNSNDAIILNLELDSLGQYKYFVCKSDRLFKLYGYGANESLIVPPRDSIQFVLIPFLYNPVPNEMRETYMSNYIKSLLSYDIYYVTENNDTIKIDRSKDSTFIFSKDF